MKTLLLFLTLCAIAAKAPPQPQRFRVVYFGTHIVTTNALWSQSEVARTRTADKEFARIYAQRQVLGTNDGNLVRRDWLVVNRFTKRVIPRTRIAPEPVLPRPTKASAVLKSVIAPPTLPISELGISFHADLLGWAKVLVSTNLTDWRDTGITAHTGDGWCAVNVYPLPSEQQMLFVRIFALNGRGEWAECSARVNRIVR